MRCFKKIHHHYLTYSFVGLLASFFISFFVSSSPSFATSVHCSLVLTDTTSYSFGMSQSGYTTVPNCDLTPFFDYSNVSDVYMQVTVTGSSLTNGVSRLIFSGGSSATVNASDGIAGIATYQVFIQPNRPNFSYSFTLHNHSQFQRLTLYNLQNIPSTGYTVSITFTDTSPCPECEDCDDCLPCEGGGNYTSQLNAIEKAIYTCGAVLIVLYFFFCLYQIIIKNGSNRR